KLNLFKRAKLLNSFKWRLLERGFDAAAADELTQLVLMQLCTNGADSGIPTVDEIPVRNAGKSARHIPMLLAEADTRLADGKHAEAAERLQEVLAIDQ